MSKIVILFSGQGAQKVGMGHDFFQHAASARKLAEEADRLLGFNLTEIMFQGPDDVLTQTSKCQPALYLHGMMALTLLRECLPNLELAAAAGLSLGEFTAHAAVGTFDFSTGLNLVARRGQFMEQACAATQGSMAALIGGDEKSVRNLAQAADVDIANFNAPGQIVLSGTQAGIAAAIAQAKDFGIRRAIPLNVAGAYHSRLMASAQEKLADVLDEVAWKFPNIPVVSNVAATAVKDIDEIRQTLEKQVTGSVRWTESMQGLIAQGHRTFVELGPGKVIAGLLGKIDKDITVYSIDDIASLEATAAALA